jgi:hypothetical protein
MACEGWVRDLPGKSGPWPRLHDPLKHVAPFISEHIKVPKGLPVLPMSPLSRGSHLDSGWVSDLLGKLSRMHLSSPHPCL